MSLIGLLIFIILIGLIVWIVQMLPLPAPWKQIALVIVCVIVLIYLLDMLGGVGLGGPVLRLR